MSKPDYDNPEVEKQWCVEQRANVCRYLDAESVEYGRIGKWPAWHVAPYVSVWAIESKTSRGWIGWWVISGDLPTDYVSATEIKHPRKAVQAIADRWRDYCASVQDGKLKTDYTVEGVEGSREHLSMLEARASTLLRWVEDDSLWEDL